MRYSHFFSWVVISFLGADNLQSWCLHETSKSAASISCSTLRARILFSPSGSRHIAQEVRLSLCMHFSQAICPLRHCLICPLGISLQMLHSRISPIFLFRPLNAFSTRFCISSSEYVGFVAVEFEEPGDRSGTERLSGPVPFPTPDVDGESRVPGPNQIVFRDI